MARNNNAYEKRQRDHQKKQKLEDKRARRLRRKEGAQNVGVPDSNNAGPDDAAPTDAAGPEETPQ